MTVWDLRPLRAAHHAGVVEVLAEVVPCIYRLMRSLLVIAKIESVTFSDCANTLNLSVVSNYAGITLATGGQIVNEANMSEGTRSSSGSGSLPVRLWRRVPVIVRAVVTGLLVALMGPIGVGVPLQINLKVFPNLPWSIPVAAIWLWLFWRYFSGRLGWPRSTYERRRELLRAHSLSPALWLWSILTCALLLSFNIAFQFAYSRFQPISAALPQPLLALPPLTLLCVLLMLSAQAGIVEEAAFRGYMLTPIQQRHGSVIATLIVSIVFVLAHFNNPQNLTAFRVTYIFWVGVVYCVLVVVTQSILPGLIVHVVGDAIGLLLLWRAQTSKKLTVQRLGSLGDAIHDPAFLMYATLTTVLGLAALLSFLRLRRVASREIPKVGDCTKRS